MNLNTLSLQFNIPITFREIRRFRGAFIEMNDRKESLFHNHKDDKIYHHRYPLVQYRAINNKAGLFAMGQGAEAIQKALSSGKWQIRWKNKTVKLALDQTLMEEHPLIVKKELEYTYHIKNYLPFNDQHFDNWKKTENLLQKIELLTNIIPGHILAFAKEVEWKIPIRFDIELTDFNRQQAVVLHNLKRPSFDLEFRSNISLPSGIGLGKGVSHGYGVLSHSKKTI